MRDRGTLRRGREDGAALVEFAVLAPMLLLLALGMVEFGWLFGQFNDVRHGAREGARYAAVNGGDENTIANRVCQSMDGLDAGMTLITITLSEVDSNGTAGIQRGDTGTLQVVADVSSLSNVPLISIFLPSQLSSTVEFRMEQDPDLWAPATIAKAGCP
jgi:Flp pilus assembly protein TadG